MPAWISVNYLSPSVQTVGADSVICCHLLVDQVYGTRLFLSLRSGHIWGNYIVNFFRLAGHFQKFGRSNIGLCLKIVIRSVATVANEQSVGAWLSLRASGDFIGKSWRIYVIKGRGRWWQFIHLPVHGAGWPVTPAAPAQHQPSHQAEEGWRVAQIHNQTDLVLQPVEEEVIEIHNNVTGSPGDCYQAKHSRAEKRNGPAQC